MKSKLPLTPSKLVRVARHDLMKARKLKNVVIDMGVWHAPLRHGMPVAKATKETPCRMCQAGAVMTCTLGVDINTLRRPDHFEEVTQDQLHALNYLRANHVHSFLRALRHVSKLASRWIEKDNNCVPEDLSAAYYEYSPVDPKPYFAWLKRVEKWLISEGL